MFSLPLIVLNNVLRAGTFRPALWAATSLGGPEETPPTGLGELEAGYPVSPELLASLGIRAGPDPAEADDLCYEQSHTPDLARKLASEVWGQCRHLGRRPHVTSQPFSRRAGGLLPAPLTPPLLFLPSRLLLLENLWFGLFAFFLELALHE